MPRKPKGLYQGVQLQCSVKSPGLHSSSTVGKDCGFAWACVQAASSRHTQVRGANEVQTISELEGTQSASQKD